MSDPNRRTSRDEEDDEPLRFDDRRGRPRRRGGPAPITLILSLLVLGGVGGGVFYMYRGGSRGTNDAPQPVGAPLGDVRTAAPPQVQAPDPAAGLSIYKNDPNASVPPAFVPPPEQPTARTTATAVAPSAPPPTGPTSTTQATNAPSEADSPGAAAKPMSKPKANATKPSSVDDILNPPARAAAPPAVAATTAKTLVSPTVGGAVIQIGAFSSESLADHAWSAAAAVAPGAMAGKGKRVVPMEKDGATLYRTAITGFSTHEAATTLCDTLRAAGKSCFVR